jgi:hypothetical protein
MADGIPYSIEEVRFAVERPAVVFEPYANDLLTFMLEQYDAAQKRIEELEAQRGEK